MIIFFDGIIYACVLAVLCVGLTLTYKITKIPNFAHVSFAILGMYVALVAIQIFDANPYVALPFAFVASGGVAFVLYYGIIRVLQNKKSSYLSLIIATLSFDMIMIGVLNIIADYISNEHQIIARDFTLRSFDVIIYGVPMILIVSVATILSLVFGLYYLLYRTSFGIKMRASIENRQLAQIFGINTNRIFCFSWFLSGGLGGIAGVLMALWFQGDPYLAAIMLPSVFAGSIVGGFTSIYGAILGGLIIGISEIVGTNILAGIFGYWITPYRPLIPFLFIIATLLLSPKGISEIIARVKEK